MSGAVAQFFDAFAFGTVVATEHAACFLQPVTDDADATMRACRSQRVDCAFEAVEDMGLSCHHDLEGLVVFIATAFALRHASLPYWRSCPRQRCQWRISAPGTIIVCALKHIPIRRICGKFVQASYALPDFASCVPRGLALDRLPRPRCHYGEANLSLTKPNAAPLPMRAMRRG